MSEYSFARRQLASCLPRAHPAAPSLRVNAPPVHRSFHDSHAFIPEKKEECNVAEQLRIGGVAAVASCWEEKEAGGFFNVSIGGEGNFRRPPPAAPPAPAAPNYVSWPSSPPPPPPPKRIDENRAPPTQPDSSDRYFPLLSRTEFTNTFCD